MGTVASNRRPSRVRGGSRVEGRCVKGLRQSNSAHHRCSWPANLPLTADCCSSAFTHKPLPVGDYRGCERHRFGRTVDTLQAGMLEALPPRPEDPHHLPDSRRRASRPDDAITLPNFDLYACAHDGPFRDTAIACRSGRPRDPMHPSQSRQSLKANSRCCQALLSSRVQSCGHVPVHRQ
jgi:hypothetical protein